MPDTYRSIDVQAAMGETAIGRRSAALVALEDCYSSWRRRGTQELRDALYVQCPKKARALRGMFSILQNVGAALLHGP